MGAHLFPVAMLAVAAAVVIAAMWQAGRDHRSRRDRRVSANLRHALELVLHERIRQREHEMFSEENDDDQVYDELAWGAASYLSPLRLEDRPPPSWPWARHWWKPGPPTREGRIRELEKGLALGLAELERQLRLQTAEILINGNAPPHPDGARS